MDFGYVVSSQALNQDLDDGALEPVASPESDGCRSCSSEARLHRRIRFALLFVFYVFVLATLCSSFILLIADTYLCSFSCAFSDSRSREKSCEGAMGGSKGKARKRREANYSAAHPGITPQLAPPPSAKDIVAIPSKLRRIMSLKAPSAPGHKEQQVGAANAAHNKQPKTPPNTKGGKQVPSAGKLDASKLAPPPTSDNKEPVVEEVGGKQSVPKISKRRRAEEELKALSEKFQTTPIRKGIREKRKKYLEEKKKRKRLRGITYEPVPEREIIAFGDVVQGPPKLSFPPKAKITKEQRPASHERIRSQVIEAYRQRRAGASRLIKGSVVMLDGPKVEDS